MSQTTNDNATDRTPNTARAHRRRWMFPTLVLAIALATAAITALLVNMFTRKQEGRQPFVRLVEVDEVTTDPAQWGKNWPREYDSYQRTVDSTHTRYGGSEAMAAQKL